MGQTLVSESVDYTAFQQEDAGSVPTSANFLPRINDLHFEKITKRSRVSTTHRKKAIEDIVGKGEKC